MFEWLEYSEYSEKYINERDYKILCYNCRCNGIDCDYCPIINKICKIGVLNVQRCNNNLIFIKTYYNEDIFFKT